MCVKHLDNENNHTYLCSPKKRIRKLKIERETIGSYRSSLRV